MPPSKSRRPNLSAFIRKTAALEQSIQDWNDLGLAKEMALEREKYREQARKNLKSLLGEIAELDTTSNHQTLEAEPLIYRATLQVASTAHSLNNHDFLDRPYAPAFCLDALSKALERLKQAAGAFTQGSLYR
jgi:hypothetical protein